jgi:simple sugar transport system substrate-binding protein
MNLKKLAALGLTLMLTGAIFTGCGAKQTSEPQPTSSSSAGESSTKKKIVIGFAQLGAESGWRTAETNSIKDIPNKNADIELKFSDAQQKQENQIKAIRSFIAQKVDVIAMAPIVDTGWDTVLKEAKDAKIPVILVDRGVKVSDDSLYATFIGSDFIQEGKSAAKILVDKFGKDAKVNIAELQGTTGASAATDRKKGFE